MEYIYFIDLWLCRGKHLTPNALRDALYDGKQQSFCCKKLEQLKKDFRDTSSKKFSGDSTWKVRGNNQR